MLEFWKEPWFIGAVCVAIGLPVLLIVLTEVLGALTRRQSPAAKPVRLLRNLVLPVGALLALLAFAGSVTVELTWVRVVATVFGFLLILLVLSAFNVVLFGNATPGTWRNRLPSIFIDLARLLLIVVGLALLFWWVWGADVGGLFAAIGVTSVVIGFALQSAVGSVVSGLLLLFEQPFRLGDWLDTGSVRGRVVEVNWRAVHIETDEGVQIVPNASLADSSFTNLSRTPGAYFATTTLAFAPDDAPHDVMALLRQLAIDLPMTDPAVKPVVTFSGNGSYSVAIPVLGPAAAGDALAVFTSWLWYATRRAGLTLDGSKTDPANTPEAVRAALLRVASTLRIPVDGVEVLIESCRIERYAAGEIVQREGLVPSGIQVVIEGSIGLFVVVGGPVPVALGSLDGGEYVGQTALTRERTLTRAVAESPLTVLRVPTGVIDSLVQKHPALAKEISQTIERRRSKAREAVATTKAVIATLS
ncbi:mechanosensitive ion channel domain-containing protein [Herbiconiux daphne]|uniref:Mechanosensitive ion channel n=1 Tax=Herbiconiux daphne TaxID=2970914 RepID=A0ABT2H360_9MICO|nr:mechanosensitive ion channel domain-containing protein [Herbiconiux daphne]MCS5734378.1 mechanosensitive ion channel [Herbiconiux daphne]